MREMFEQFVIRFCFAGLGATALVAFVLATYPMVDEQIGKPLGRAVRSRRISILIPIVCVCGTILFAIDKSPVPMPAPRAQVRMIAPSSSMSAAEEAAMAEADEGMLLIGHWFRSGAHDIEYPVSFDDGWVFPYGSNHLSRIEIMAYGKVCAGGNNPVPLAAISEDLSCRPQVTRVYCGFTTNDSYRVEWREAYANRDHNQPMNASIELFRNGDISITEDGVTRTIRRKLPFAHDGFGQDADWVKANFTNAAEIISVGYANWVDAQVGIGLTNGLYRFTASFKENPLEATEFHIGDYSICVTNAGEYVFLQEKGTGYEFGTRPYDESVDYYVQDDVADDAPMLAASWGGWESPGEWSVDGGWNWLYSPTPNNSGYCCWMPTLQGSPNVTYLGLANLPATFAAILTDYCGSATPVFRWSASDENIEFGSPNARTTTVSCASLPSWGALSMSVQANLGGYSLWSYLYPTYGTNETPQVACDLSAPQVVFLNDDDRSTRYYRVSLSVDCPVATNVTVTINHEGESGARFFSDAQGENEITLPANLSYALSDSRSVVFDGYVSCARLGAGMIHATVTTADGMTIEKNVAYEVIEPLRKLVSTTIADDGGIVNPSRLTHGTNAWLEVDRNGRYSANEITWRVVSGPGEIVMTNRFRACVRATDSNGTVVVEASFGKDAHVQPQFVLPVVVKRRIPVSVYYVPSLQGLPPDRSSRFDSDLEIANRVFGQVGIEFYLKAGPQKIGNFGYAVLREYENDELSDQAWSLINMLPTTDKTLRVVYVHDIIQGTELGFSVFTNKVTIMGAKGTEFVLAHELGHLLGLDDIYSRDKRMQKILMAGWKDEAYREIFENAGNDWGDELGRAFYESSDVHGELVDSLLMNGFDGCGGMDIPCGRVLGFPPEPKNIFDVRMIKVGADFIRGEQ